ncbi:extracellular solute-binding protein [Streptomyces sp. FXJ1.4098]|nr:extracellular solute-binding protein [Streptomyces sp. FXJ1.4098]
MATIEYPQLPSFTIDGVPRDITKLLPDSVRGKILPQALDLTTFEGRTYAVPVDIEPMVFLYRKDIFTKNHIPVPKTWAEFETSARKLKKAEPRSRIASLFTTGGTLYMAAYAWQAGAQWYDTADDTWRINMDDAPTRKVARYWQRLMDQDLVRVEPGSSQQWRAHLRSGETVGYLAGAWAAGSMMASTPTARANGPSRRFRSGTRPSRRCPPRAARPSWSPRTVTIPRRPWSSSPGWSPAPTHSAPSSPAVSAAPSRSCPIWSRSPARRWTPATTPARTSSASSSSRPS